MLTRLVCLLTVSVIFTRSFSQADIGQTDKFIDKNKVSAFLQNEQFTDAIAYLESRNVSTSNDINAINDLGYAYFKDKNYLSAQQRYLKVTSLDSLNFTANKYLAYISRHDKDYQKELFHYLRLIRIQPTAASLYKLTGDSYLDLKNTDTALQYYAHAYNLLPVNETIAEAFASELIDEKMYARADSVAREYLKTDSLNYAITRLAIKSFYQQKKMAEAAQLTKNWLAIDEIDPKTAVYLARANYNIKNYEACFKVCDTLLKQGIETEAIFYYASQGKFKLNDFNASNELLRQCLKLAISENTNVYYYSRADNFEALKQYKKAIAAYDTAFYLFKDPLALYNIGRLYDQGLKNNALARQYYKRYLGLAVPANKDEQRVYAYVKEIMGSNKK